MEQIKVKLNELQLKENIVANQLFKIINMNTFYVVDDDRNYYYYVKKLKLLIDGITFIRQFKITRVKIKLETCEYYNDDYFYSSDKHILYLRGALCNKILDIFENNLDTYYSKFPKNILTWKIKLDMFLRLESNVVYLFDKILTQDDKYDMLLDILNKKLQEYVSKNESHIVVDEDYVNKLDGFRELLLKENGVKVNEG